MVFVAVTETVESTRVVTNNHRIHTFGDGNLPRIVFSQAVGGSTLPQCRSLSLLAPDNLPAEGPKRFAHRVGVRGTLQHFGRSDRRNPEFGFSIAHSPRAGRPRFIRGDLVKQIDHERGIEQTAFHGRGDMRSRRSPACRSAHARRSAPVAISSSRINLRTNVAFFIPARLERFVRMPCSSLVRRTVRIADIVCHLYALAFIRQAPGAVRRTAISPLSTMLGGE